MTEYPCPDCNKPLRCYFDRPGQPREFMCEIAIRGKMLGKIGRGYKHAEAWVYVEKIIEN